MSVQSDAAPVSRDVARTSVLLIFRRGLLMVASGLSTVYVARYLAPGEYGVLQGAVATWTLTSGVTDFGFSVVLGRDFASQPERRPALLRAAYEVQLVIALAMSGVLVCLAFGAGIASTQGLCLVVLAPSVLLTGLNAGRVLYTATFDVRKTVKIDLITNLTQIALTVGVALAGGGPVGVAAVISLGTAINALWVGVSAAGTYGLGRTDRAARFGLAKRALPLGVMAVLSKLYISVDVAILSFVVVGPSLGHYAAAAKIIMLANLVPAILFGSVLSGLAQVAGDRAALADLVRRVWTWLTALVMPAFVIMGVFAGPVVRIVLGAAYAPASGMLSVLCIAGVLGLISQLLGNLLVVFSDVRALIVQSVVALLLNVAANVGLAPHFGVYVAAWATVGTELFIVAGAAFALRRGGHPVPALRIPVGVVLMLAFAIVAGLATPAPGTVQCVVTAVSYLLLSSALGEWPFRRPLVRLLQTRGAAS